MLWSFDGEYTQRSVGSIAYGNGLVFATFGSGSQGRDGVALRPKATGAPEVAYELGLSDGLGYVPTPLYIEGGRHNDLLQHDTALIDHIDAFLACTLATVNSESV